MRIASAVLGLILTVAVPSVAMAGEYGPGAPTATVNKTTYVVGETVTLNGSGFTPNTGVTATISPSASGFPKNGTTDGSGNVTFTFPAPPAGSYTVTITENDLAPTGLSASYAPKAASTGFTTSASSTTTSTTIVGGGGPIPTTTVAPAGPTTTVVTGGTVASGGPLPSTGSSVTGQLWVAFIALLAGLGLVMVAMRRRRTAPTQG